MAVITPAFLQTKKYSASALRALMLDVPIQNGVTNAGDLLASQRGAGANMSIDVAAGSLWLKGTSSTRQGFYDIYNDATVNLAIGANGSGAGTYRIDQLVAHVYDSVDGGAAQDIGALEIVAGTSSNAFGSAALALNARTGAGVVPANAMVLADIAVVGGAGSITNAAIRDRRPWGRGGFVRALKTAGTPTTTTAIGATAYIDNTAGGLVARLECSGVPVRVTLHAMAAHNTANGGIDFSYSVDGAIPADVPPTLYREQTPSANVSYPAVFSHVYVPAAAGSHVFAATWGIVNAGTATLGTPTYPAALIVEELIRQNSANNPVGYS